MIAAILALALLDAGPPLGPFIPWPTSEPRPTLAAPLREAILPTVRPRGPALALPIVARLAAFRGASKTPTATATPTPRPTPTRAALRPQAGDWRALERALMVPGAMVIPEPGEYRPTRVLHMAKGATLEAFGAVLLDRGLYLHHADGATIRGLTVTGTTGDGIQVSASRDVLIERVNLSACGDGCADLVETYADGRLSAITVRDSIIHDSAKCSLAGDQGEPQDANLRIRFERVTFARCRERSPKVQFATLTIVGGTVSDWGSTAVDARHGARVYVSGTRFFAGKGSGARFQQSIGGAIFDDGTNPLTPWGGRD